MHFRPLPLMTGLGIVSLIILVMLGNWQWDRFQEKVGLEETPSVPFETLTVTPIAMDGGFAQQLNGQAAGRFIWRRYVPATLAGDDQPVLLMYDTVTSIELRPLSLENTSPVTAEFAVFTAELQQNVFANKDRPEENRWSRRNAEKMLGNLGFEISGPVRLVEPRTIKVVDPQRGIRRVDNPYAAPKPIDDMPPARHLGYALTWWGLAFGLIAVYIAFHVARGRLRLGKGAS